MGEVGGKTLLDLTESGQSIAHALHRIQEEQETPKSYYDMSSKLVPWETLAIPIGLSKPIEPISKNTAKCLESYIKSENYKFVLREMDLDSVALREHLGVTKNKYHQKTNYKPKYTL